jgi:hypothetical protein
VDVATSRPQVAETGSAPALRRTLSLWQVSLSGIGVILGAGVYALVGPAAGLAGNALWLAFLLAGVAAGLTAYSYARLGTMRPKDSPEFQYRALAFGPRIGFLAGWLMLAADLLARGRRRPRLRRLPRAPRRDAGGGERARAPGSDGRRPPGGHWRVRRARDPSHRGGGGWSLVRDRDRGARLEPREPTWRRPTASRVCPAPPR